MKYLLPLLLSVPLLGQVTLSQEEMLGIANNIKELQHSDSSKSVQISIYEDLVKEMDNQIKLFQANILNRKWDIKKTNYEEDANFFIVDKNTPNKNIDTVSKLIIESQNFISIS